MPHKWYQGKTGVVWNVTKRAIGVEINKRVSGGRQPGVCSSAAEAQEPRSRSVWGQHGARREAIMGKAGQQHAGAATCGACAPAELGLSNSERQAVQGQQGHT